MLKKAATALRAAIDTVLRPLELTVPQYSCLEVLDQRPGLSSSELARATFVTRQSMNLVLQGLQQRGLLTRAAVADHGKALPTGLTDAGRVQLRAASVAVRTIGHVTALDHVFLPALFVGALGGAAFGQLIGPRSGLRNVRGENGGPGGGASGASTWTGRYRTMHVPVGTTRGGSDTCRCRGICRRITAGNGTDSVIGPGILSSGMTAEYSPPTPIAVTNRKIRKIRNVGENALITVAVEYITRVATNSRLRPKRSASQPKVSVDFAQQRPRLFGLASATRAPLTAVMLLLEITAAPAFAPALIVADGVGPAQPGPGPRQRLHPQAAPGRARPLDVRVVAGARLSPPHPSHDDLTPTAGAQPGRKPMTTTPPPRPPLPWSLR